VPVGTVKWFDAKKGQGFIARDEGPDVFVHYATGGDRPELTEGAKVEFDIREGKEGPEAVDVRLVER
jgi:cold shock protein